MSKKNIPKNHKELTKRVIGGKKYYCEQENIGEGHMGIVTFAYDQQNKKYAIKKLKDPENKEIFLESGKVMKHLNNLDYLVNTSYHGEDNNGDCHIVMEAMEENLSQVIDEFIGKDKLTNKELSVAYTYTYKLFKALDELHQKSYNGNKMTHNDLLPSNVLVTNNELKLTDLLAIPEGMTNEEFKLLMSKSSLAYMGREGNQSPFRLHLYYSVEDPSIKRDIRQAGLIATELLTGQDSFTVSSLGIKEYNLKNGNEPLKESIETIIDETTIAKASKRPSTKKVIKAFETEFTDEKGLHSDKYFVMLDDGFISRPADRYQRHLDNIPIGKGIFDKGKLNDEKVTFNTFLDKDGVDADERIEINGYYNRFKQTVKDNTLQQIASKEKRIEEINDGIVVKSDEVEEDKKSVDQYIKIDDLIKIPNRQALLNKITKNINDQKQLYDNDYATFFGEETVKKEKAQKKIDDLNSLIAAIDKDDKKVIS